MAAVDFNDSWTQYILVQKPGRRFGDPQKELVCAIAFVQSPRLHATLCGLWGEERVSSGCTAETNIGRFEKDQMDWTHLDTPDLV